MNIDAWTFDVGTTENHVEAMARRVEQSWDTGADIVLFPEYSWAAMAQRSGGLLPQPDENWTGRKTPLRRLAHHFWTDVMPVLQKRLTRPNKMVVLGSAPFVEDNDGPLYNRAPILIGGHLYTQDKLFLTPWEKALASGGTLRVFEFHGVRIAVVICLDIEIAELSVLLRSQRVDLVLVPSATETLMGCERVTRCASARAVELGCGVVVSPLVGKCSAPLVDMNLGKLGCYFPSQGAFATEERIRETSVYTEGFHMARFTLRLDALHSMRHDLAETNPSTIPPVHRLPHVQIC